MSHRPHADTEPVLVSCGILTVSDTRTQESDRSGQVIQEWLTQARHPIADYQIVRDEPTDIAPLLDRWCQRDDIDAVILNGGTGIAPRDTTYEVVEQRLTQVLPGFGELFRYLSYQEIGSRAIASRATAGVAGGTLIFSLPGSSNAVRLAMEKLIIPELPHLLKQLHPERFTS
jgi:molybdenum cofactor biosynthesis protein B